MKIYLSDFVLEFFCEKVFFSFLGEKIKMDEQKLTNNISGFRQKTGLKMLKEQKHRITHY